MRLLCVYSAICSHEATWWKHCSIVPLMIDGSTISVASPYTEFELYCESSYVSVLLCLVHALAPVFIPMLLLTKRFRSGCCVGCTATK